MSKIAIRINSADIVAVALQPLAKGTEVTLEASGNAPETKVTLTEDITAGHKFAIRDIKKDEPIIKYGYPIGATTQDIPVGSHVHTHNIHTLLSEKFDYTYDEANAKAAYEKWYNETEDLRKNVPSVTQYIAKNGSVPKLLSFSIAALISFYNGTEIKADEKGAKYLESKREEGVYPNKDTLPVLEFFAALNKETKDAKVIANRVLSNVEFWKEDLTKYEGLEASVAANLADIQSKGMKAALADIVK